VRTTLLAATLALAFPTDSSAQEGESSWLPYADLAQSALHRAGMTDVTPETFQLDDFLAAGFLHTRVGLFDLYLPVEGTPAADELAEHRTLVLSVLDVQRQWLDWLAPGGADVGKPLADLERLRSWIESWKIDMLAREVAAGKRETLEALGPKPAVLEAAERLAAFMGSGAALALDRPTAPRESLILVPDRERFVELGCLVGWVSPYYRTSYWRADLIHWIEGVLEPCHFLALELLDPERAKQDWRAGIPLEHWNRRAAEQQVSYVTAELLLANYYEGRLPSSLLRSLSIDLVLDVFGESDTFTTADPRPGREPETWTFVSGDSTMSHVADALDTKNRWRDGRGAGHFVSLLRGAQKRGAARANDGEEHRHFELVEASGVRRTLVTTPFLGTAPRRGEPLPPEFHEDWGELQRAYGACFLWWLQTRGERDGKRSAESFAALLRALAGGERRSELSEVFASVYAGTPLSGDEPGRGDLEGRFLLWLARQR